MGTICNVSHSSCDHSIPDVMKVPWFKKKPALDFKNGEKVRCQNIVGNCGDKYNYVHNYSVGYKLILLMIIFITIFL